MAEAADKLVRDSDPSILHAFASLAVQQGPLGGQESVENNAGRGTTGGTPSGGARPKDAPGRQASGENKGGPVGENPNLSQLRESCWAAALSDSTVEVLVINGIDSLLALQVLQPGDFALLGLPLGQFRLLEALVNALRAVALRKDRGGQANISQSDAPVGSGSSAVLSDAPGNTSTGRNPAHAPDTVLADDGPLGVEHNGAKPTFQASLEQPVEAFQQEASVPWNVSAPGKSNTKKLLGLGPQGESLDYLAIKKHVSMLAESKESWVQMPDGSWWVPKGTGSKKIELRNVTEAQYMEANARIMAILLLQNKLDQQGIFDYLAYTIYIAQLAQKRDWVSVLRFDDDYRKAQAAGGVQWGEDVSYIRELTLEDKKPPNVPHGPSQKFPHAGKQGKGPKKKFEKGGTGNASSKTCINFNKPDGCSYPSCKFKHICEGCGAANHALPACKGN
jgi:hypothetical protein